VQHLEGEPLADEGETVAERIVVALADDDVDLALDC